MVSLSSGQSLFRYLCQCAGTILPSSNQAQHLHNGFSVVLPVHCLTVARGAVTLASAVVIPTPLRAVALYLKTLEGVGSLMIAPEVVRAVANARYGESLSLSCMHSTRSIKTLLTAARCKLNPVFIDLLATINTIGAVTGVCAEQSRLRVTYNLFEEAGRPGFNWRTRDSRYSTPEQYTYAKGLAVAVSVVALAALIMPLVSVSSAWGAHFVLLIEVTYAALCILNYLYEGHATHYLGALSGRDPRGGNNDDSASCASGKSGGDEGGLKLAGAAPPSATEGSSTEQTENSGDVDRSLVVVGSNLATDNA